jgi:mRNA interferase MazF
MTDKPMRGEIWWCDLGKPSKPQGTKGRPSGSDPAGHEQQGIRPVLVLSTNRLNNGKSGLAIVIPSTRTNHDRATHVDWVDPKGQTGNFMCEQIRCVQISARFGKRIQPASAETLARVEKIVKLLLEVD